MLPAIIFFVALAQLLYYWGTVQWAIGEFAVVFYWSMKISGAESVAAAATPCIGQGESAMLIKGMTSDVMHHTTIANLGNSKPASDILDVILTTSQSTNTASHSSRI